jgi:hypothetical protein
VTPEPALRSESFDVHCALGLPLEEMAEAAERTRLLAYEWAGAPPRPASRPLPVHLCTSQEEVFALEKRHKLPYAADPRRKQWSIAGGFYRDVPMIAVQVTPWNAKLLLCHEVVHSVIEELAPSCPDAINEGAAELLSERAAATAWQADWERGHRRKLALGLLERGAALSLRGLMTLTYWQFRGDARSENFMLGGCLVRVLEREAWRGRIPRYFARLREGARRWPAFAEVFPVSSVEAEWIAQVRRCADGLD